MKYLPKLQQLVSGVPDTFTTFKPQVSTLQQYNSIKSQEIIKS